MSLRSRIERMEGVMGSRLGPAEAAARDKARRGAEAIISMNNPRAPQDPDDWTPKVIKADPWRQEFVETFGTPEWKDGAWVWPARLPDPDEWTAEAIQGDSALCRISQAIVKDRGLPLWRDGDWFWPEPGSPEFQEWGGVDRPNAIQKCLPD